MQHERALLERKNFQGDVERQIGITCMLRLREISSLHISVKVVDLDVTRKKVDLFKPFLFTANVSHSNLPQS